MKEQLKEMRYIGLNWKTPKHRRSSVDRPEKPSARKIVTRGTIRSDLSGLLAEWAEILNEGYEVRLTLNGEDALRLMPFVDGRNGRSFIKADTLNAFRRSIDDIRTAVRGPDGVSISKEEFNRLRKEARDVPPHADDVPDGTTPDIMVTCSICGNHIRVGRKSR